MQFTDTFSFQTSDSKLGVTYKLPADTELRFEVEAGASPLQLQVRLDILQYKWATFVPGLISL